MQMDCAEVTWIERKSHVAGETRSPKKNGLCCILLEKYCQPPFVW